MGTSRVDYPMKNGRMVSLYLHIPFCTRKCVYCDFYSIEGLNPLGPFLEALHTEIDLVQLPEERTVSTIFFGGGTPSLLSAGQVNQILDHLGERFRISETAEITLESNPGTLDAASLAGYWESGVNRLSVGIQSFDAEELSFLGRIHDAQQATQAVHDARSAGFTNISVDLIYALPGQTIEKWQTTLQRAIDLNPDHISAYSLIVEENTPLARMVRNRLIVPQPVEEEARFFDETVRMLANARYEQYEVSNFAQAGHRSLHNMNYWHHRDYIGFGPSAHSFWYDHAAGAARRWWNVANITNYSDRLKLRMLPIAGEELLNGETLMVERLFLGLRSDGIDLRRFRNDFGGRLLDGKESLIAQLVSEKLVTLSGETLRATTKGYLLCDEMSARLTAS